MIEVVEAMADLSDPWAGVEDLQEIKVETEEPGSFESVELEVGGSVQWKVPAAASGPEDLPGRTG